MENPSWVNELRNLAAEAETRQAIYDSAKLAEFELHAEAAIRSLQIRLRQCEAIAWEEFEKLRGEFVMAVTSHEKPMIAWAKTLGVELPAKPRETKVAKASRLLSLLLPICSGDQIRQQCQNVASAAPVPKKTRAADAKALEAVSKEQIRGFMKELAGYDSASALDALKNFDETLVKAVAKSGGITGKITSKANAVKLHDLALRFVRNTQS